MKKKLLAIFLCAAVALSVCACGNEDTPEVTEMASYADLNQVLSGEYAITDEILAMYFTEVLNDAGAGVKEVTNRDTVQDGDIVKTDYTGYKDGVAFDGGAATNQWIDVTNNCAIDTESGAVGSYYIDGFSDGLLGAKIGEKTSSAVTFPEDYGNTDLAGAETVFEFTVHAIYEEVTMQNITDEFVAENLEKVYEVTTVAEFNEFLKEELAYSCIMNYLIQNSTFEIPASYIESRVADYQAYFEVLYGVSVDEYASYYGYTVETMQEEWAEAVESQIKSELIFEKVVEEQKLALDEKAHEEYVQKIIDVNNTYFPDADSIHKYTGAGNAEAGEKYLKTQTAVREYMLENYRNTVAE